MEWLHTAEYFDHFLICEMKNTLFPFDRVPFVGKLKIQYFIFSVIELLPFSSRHLFFNNIQLFLLISRQIFRKSLMCAAFFVLTTLCYNYLLEQKVIKQLNVVRSKVVRTKVAKSFVVRTNVLNIFVVGTNSVKNHF